MALVVHYNRILWVKMKGLERRTRLKRPRSLLALGFVLLIVPFANYLYICDFYKIRISNPSLFFRATDPIVIFFLAFSLFAGCGILLVKKWGWYTFLCYAASLTVYNFILLLQFQKNHYLFVFLYTIAGFSALIFFARKDISAPYFKVYPRGWRFEKRRATEIPLSIEGNRLKSRDFSSSGFYVFWENPPYSPGDEVTVSLHLNTNPFEIRSGVARVDKSGIGFAFRGLNAKNRKSLRKQIQEFIHAD